MQVTCTVHVVYTLFLLHSNFILFQHKISSLQLTKYLNIHINNKQKVELNMHNNNKRRKRDNNYRLKQDVLLDFELCNSDKTDFFKNLKELYVEKSFCDVVFEINDGLRFQAHRIVLAASSGFLGGIIRSNDMQQCTNNEDQQIKIIHIREDGSLFKCCLDYIYGLPITIESSQIMPLLGLANKYSMISLRDQLADRLQSNLTVENSCVLFAAADTFGCICLREESLAKIFNNFAVASKTSAFNDLPYNLLILILSSDSILDCDESTIFEAAVRWISYNNNKNEIPNLNSNSNSNLLNNNNNNDDTIILSVLKTIRYALMDAGYLSDVIKCHPLMNTPERAYLLLEAFEYHALRAAGRIIIQSETTRCRKQSCTFSQSTPLDGHDDSVSALVATLDGKWLLSGSWDKNIKVHYVNINKFKYK